MFVDKFISCQLTPISMSTVASLLNPCKCKSIWKCQCSHPSDSPKKSLNKDVQMSMKMPLKQCCDSDRSPSNIFHSDEGITVSGPRILTPSAGARREQRVITSTPYTQWSHTRSIGLSIPTSSLCETSPEQHNDSLVLPPLVPLGDESDDAYPQALPSLKKVCATVLDTDGNNAAALLMRCGCGSTCACPGCKE